MQAHNDRNGKKEDPDVGDKICDVRKVGKSHKVKALGLHSRIPEAFNGPTVQSQDDGNGQQPKGDKDAAENDDFAKGWDGEDAVVECKNGELDSPERNVVEVAKDVVSLQACQHTIGLMRALDRKG